MLIRHTDILDAITQLTVMFAYFQQVLFDKNKNRDMLQFSKHYENPLNMTIIMVRKYLHASNF